MKIRTGFVSNSSSSSYVLDFDAVPDRIKSKLMRLTEMSDEFTRFTGIICNVRDWVKLIYEDCDHPPHCVISALKSGKNIVIVRESDEGMGGYFEDYNLSEEEIAPYVIGEF